MQARSPDTAYTPHLTARPHFTRPRDERHTLLNDSQPSTQRWNTLSNGATQAIVGIGMAIAISLVTFLITQSYGQLNSRLDRLEVQSLQVTTSLAAIHAQLDTINVRGTAASDTRLSAVEAAVSALQVRQTNSETRIMRLEQTR